MSELKVSVDWLRYNAPNEYPINQMIPYELTVDNSEEIAPLKNYTHALKIQPAGRVDFNTTNKKQGSLVTFTGSDLGVIRDEGITTEYLVRYTAKKKWLKASRIDLAIDIIGAVAHPLDLIDAWNDGRVKTHAKAISAVEGYTRDQKPKGETVYIGSRTSDTFLRVYDKGLEQGLENELWTRIELELKRGQAKKAQQKIGPVSLAQVVVSKLTDFVKVSGVMWWANMLFALPEATEIMKGERKSKGSENDWIMTQALPAVLKRLESGDRAVYDVILRAMIDIGKSGIYRESE